MQRSPFADLSVLLAALCAAATPACAPAGATAAATTAAPPPAAAQGTGVVLSPGQTSAPLQATGCAQYDAYTVDGTQIIEDCLVCSEDCDLAANRARAWVTEAIIVLGRRTARTTISTEFEVAATEQTRENLLPCTVNYDIEWKGFWTLFGIADVFDNTNDMTLWLRLFDVTDGRQSVRSELINKTTPEGLGLQHLIEVGAAFDQDAKVSNFGVTLRRGHRYSLELELEVEQSSALNQALTELDYYTGEKGAKWNMLTVTVGQDSTEALSLMRSLTIEDHLMRGDHLASLYLPLSAGGELERIVDHVTRLTQQSAGAGVSTNNAEYFINLSVAEISAGHYQLAYTRICTAYQLLVGDAP